MIITRSPLRISLGGGGTDLPSYYLEHGGFLVAAAIDKHVYITVNEPFANKVIAKYSKLEEVERTADLQHPILREALALTGIEERIEIASMSDIPAGTGLGSSGSFTTALLWALHTLKHDSLSKKKLAEEACYIELDRLKEPIGKQDQFIAAFGGVTAFEFSKSGEVSARPVKMKDETRANLEDNLLMFFTGVTRSASAILKDQDSRSKEKDQSMIDNLHFVKQLGYDSLKCLENDDLRGFAELMHVHWQHKKKRSQGMSSSAIDEHYETARKNGAIGGKLIGAGGGGFLMFYSEEKTKLRHGMLAAGLREVRFRFDPEGTTVVARS